MARVGAFAVAVLTLLTGGPSVEAASLGIPDHSSMLVLIGDSISAGLAKAVRSPGGSGPADTTWAISSQPGAGWGEGQNAHGYWPLGIVQGNWAEDEVRAAARRHPATIAIELGTNDALRAAFAYVTDSPMELAARLTGTDDNISTVVHLAAALASCVVLVTPSYYPPSTFGTEVQFSLQALRTRVVLMEQQTRDPHRAVLVADWAELSAPHHGHGRSTDWFTSDGLHPNAQGEQALAALIMRTAASCP